MTELTDWILRSECIKTIFELKIHDILLKNDGFLSTKDICGYVKTETQKEINSNHLQRIMRYLACFGVFEEKYEGEEIVFRATDKVKELNCYSMFRVKRLMDVLDGAVKDKVLVEHVKGMHTMAWFEGSPERLKQFKDVMQLVTKDLIPYIPKIAAEIIKEGKKDAKIVDVWWSHRSSTGDAKTRNT